MTNMRGSFLSYDPAVRYRARSSRRAVAALAHPSPGMGRNDFTNGYYPQWQHFWSSFTPVRAVFARRRGDRGRRASRSLRRCLRAPLVAHARRRRAPLPDSTRCGFTPDGDSATIVRQSKRARPSTPRASNPTRNRSHCERAQSPQMNRLAPLAHAEHGEDAARFDADLRAAWLPVVQRLGDAGAQRHPSKPPLAGWFMDKSGTSGFTNPFTLETQLAPDLLWFERAVSVKRTNGATSPASTAKTKRTTSRF